MLNRRTLRIKAMQSIFAFEQSKDSSFNIALADIDDEFQPDLNSMEVQDKELLKAQAKETKQLFKKHFEDEKPNVHEGSDPRVNTVANELISQYNQQLAKDRKAFRQKMVIDAEKIYDRFVCTTLPAGYIGLNS